MRNLLQLLTLLISLNLLSQDFHKSKNYFLSKIDKNLSMKEVQKITTADVFIQNHKNNKLKTIKVDWEFYENDGLISELNSSKLINIDKILLVNISNCACYCSEEKYYWLIDEKEKWIELPKINEEDFEISQTTKSYIFLENEIQLIEKKFKIIDYQKGEMEIIYKKVLKKFSWDGVILNEL